MDLNGEFHIPASREMVWQALNDSEVPLWPTKDAT